jgi:hypothetical protein
MGSKNGHILNGIDYLLELNREQSRAFVEPGNELARKQYRSKHPTEIGVLKCMDGRLHLPVMTNTELGIIQPWRNLGGKFDLGWKPFGLLIKEWVDYAVSRGRDVNVLITYHYARGDKHRGCRGFGYDTEAAKAFTADLKKQFDRVFGRRVVYANQVGVETDLDALILHGENGEVVDLAELHETSSEVLSKMLWQLYPSMPERLVRDFLPLVEGNIAHIAEIQGSNRAIADAEHKEWVLGIGRGFDWLHEINTALIVGPFDPDLANAIETAAGIIKGNLDAGRISKDRGIVLMTSSPYRNEGPERTLAEEHTKFLTRFTLDIIKNKIPELVPYLKHITATTNMNSRALDVLDRS